MNQHYFFSEFAKLYEANNKRNLPQLNSYDFILYRFPERECELEQARKLMHESDYASSQVDSFLDLYAQCCFLIWEGLRALIAEYRDLGERSQQEMGKIIVQRRIDRARAIKEELKTNRGNKSNRKTLQHSKQSLPFQERPFL